MSQNELPLPLVLADNALSNATVENDALREFAETSDAHRASLIGLAATAASDGVFAGESLQAPADERIHLLGNTLRHVHAKEMFGYCVEDGDPYPCKTIRALDIMGAGTRIEW